MPIASVRYDRSGHVVRLDLAGQIRGAAAVRLQLTILGVIIAEQPNELIIDLHAATTLSNSGVYALTTGYRAAIEYGTRFRVINAEHQVDRALRAAGVHDALADSDDIGALLLSLLNRASRPTQ